MALAHFILGMAVEGAKLKARRKARQLADTMHQAIEQLPDDTATAPCTGDLLCERRGVRHKQGCIGRTIPFADYAKALENK